MKINNRICSNLKKKKKKKKGAFKFILIDFIGFPPFPKFKCMYLKTFFCFQIVLKQAFTIVWCFHILYCKKNPLRVTWSRNGLFFRSTWSYDPYFFVLVHFLRCNFLLMFCKLSFQFLSLLYVSLSSICGFDIFCLYFIPMNNVQIYGFKKILKEKVRKCPFFAPPPIFSFF